MKIESKHTPGPWMVEGPFIVARHGIPSARRIATTLGLGSEELKANAALIAEAGTVATETGLTPRQLAEQRAELLEACKLMLPMHEDYQADLESPNYKGSLNFVRENRANIERFRAAIAKCEKAS